MLSGLELVLTQAHTAGLSTPASTAWQPIDEGDGVVYTAGAVAWTTAPGHVELRPANPYELDGCVWALPAPLFSYDITAP